MSLIDDLAREVRQENGQAAPGPPPGREPPPLPAPVPASRLVRADPSAGWLWNGYVHRGEVTLLSALWKAGKTTLLAHLLRALESGGDFCGRRAVPCRVLYVAEESESRWAQRRDAVGIADHVEFLIRPFAGRPQAAEWAGLIAYLKRLTAERGYDVLVCDTLANLWPVRDENDAARVQECLMPLHGLTASAALLLVHHIRKSDGPEATAARGSGALSAFVDTILELRRYNAGDRGDHRRVLTGYGRRDETPEEMVVELAEGGYRVHGDRRQADCADLSAVLDGLLPDGPPGLTADQVVEQWPGDTAPSRQRLLDALRVGVESGRWRRAGTGRRGCPFVHWTNDSVSVPPLYRGRTETETESADVVIPFDDLPE